MSNKIYSRLRSSQNETGLLIEEIEDPVKYLEAWYHSNSSDRRECHNAIKEDLESMIYMNVCKIIDIKDIPIKNKIHRMKWELNKNKNEHRY